MTLAEAEATLPNGLHDAELLGFRVDYVARTAEFQFNAWVGDLNSKDEAVREKHQDVKLLLHGLQFLVIDEPDPAYGFHSGTPRIGGFGAWTGGNTPPAKIAAVVAKLPTTAFYDSTFVDDWNSFIHLAAEDAEIKLIEE